MREAIHVSVGMSSDWYEPLGNQPNLRKYPVVPAKARNFTEVLRTEALVF